MKGKEEIAGFYNDFISYQVKTGVNERIFSLYKRLKKEGLSTDSNGLELGCGIGTLTRLMLRKVKRGNIESVDLSEKSIEYAIAKTKGKARFFCGDVVTHQPQIQGIDFITLFDIIEHIPTGRHGELFSNVASYCGEETKILINIPSPESIEYYQKNSPEELQAVDQPVYIDFLTDIFRKHDLTVTLAERYSLWKKDDLVFYVLRKSNGFSNEKLVLKQSILSRVKGKMERTKIKYFYQS